MSGGGGRRWREEQREVLDHAKGLYYDKAPGGSLIEETDDKAKWVAWRDKFGDFKSKNIPLEESGQAWWQTYPASVAAESSGGESSGGGGLLSPPPVSIDRGPYPLPNEYFPLLTTDYVRPQAYDDTAFGYVPNWIESGPFPGLLYQTGTQQYHEAFPLHESILEYQPNRFGVGPVQFMGTFDGPMNVVPPEELFVEEEEEEENEEDKRGGTGGSTPVGGIGTGGPSGVTGVTTADTQGFNTSINSSTMGGSSDIRLKKNIKFLGKSNTLDINKLRSNSTGG